MSSRTCGCSVYAGTSSYRPPVGLMERVYAPTDFNTATVLSLLSKHANAVRRMRLTGF